MTKYNDPFHFALPRDRASASALSQAVAHIADTFAVVGKVTHVGSELAFDLYRIDAEVTV